jgi:hypothetical protein
MPIADEVMVFEAKEYVPAGVGRPVPFHWRPSAGRHVDGVEVEATPAHGTNRCPDSIR